MHFLKSHSCTIFPSNRYFIPTLKKLSSKFEKKVFNKAYVLGIIEHIMSKNDFKIVF